jgi:zinc transporter, ZIP family
MTAAILAAKQRIEAQIPAWFVYVVVAALLLIAAAAALDAAPSWEDMRARLPTWSIPQLGTTASLLAGLATALGALPLLFIKRVSDQTRDGMLGFGAGVMLAASCFSLILPGIDAAQALTGSKTQAALIVAAGLGAGALFLFLSHNLIPHEHFIKGPDSVSSMKLKQIWLFVGAVTLHNFPEGLAVGVGFGGGNLAEGAALALGIGLQNMPEGLVVALAMLTVGYSRMKAFGVALVSGLVEPVGGAFGAGVMTLAQPLLPWALAFAAGAMLFVVSHEIIPESHRNGNESRATGGVLVGFAIMMVLDIALG